MLKVHRKTIAGHGKRLHCTGAGWAVSCKCGWTGEASNRDKAKAAYAEHKATAKPACSKCRAELTEENTALSHPHICKACATRRVKDWATHNRAAFDGARWKSHLKRHFGITPEEYGAIWKAQGECCAICRQRSGDSRGSRPHVDHCHETGKVRGILCNLCNSGLGQFRDDIALMQRAIEYLQLHKGVSA